MGIDPQFWTALAGIIWVDFLLSGDNAIVIAMVCRKLPPRQRAMGMLLGSSAAIALRIIFSFFIAKLIAVPGISIAGGAFLLYIAAKLAIESDERTEDPEASPSLWSAVATIAIADAGMSLDNVMAIAGLAHGNVWLMAIGVALSIPLVIAGSSITSRLLERFPFLKWAGAALLGWTGGGILASDPFIIQVSNADSHMLHYVTASLGLLCVLAAAHAARRLEPRAVEASPT